MSTRKLVDSGEEQELLEELIDSLKPRSVFAGTDVLHFLLHTPFRYPPLRHGSRFGTRAEPSLWYGSRELRCAFAESSYYRLLFIEGSSADLDPISVSMSAFKASVRTTRGVDLTAPPFDAHRAAISSPVRYGVSQRLGRDMRTDGVEAFRYASARDVLGGVNVAVFSPRAFRSSRPDALENWHCTASASGVEFVRLDYFEKKRFSFPRSDFEVSGVLPQPAF